jgi:hypothetical protein
MTGESMRKKMKSELNKTNNEETLFN